MNLQNEWYSLCKRLGLGTEATKYLTHLKIAYAEPHRHYHTLEHVRDCLMLHHKTIHLVDYPMAIEIALWFHDMVYDPLADDNEPRSAAACRAWLDQGNADEVLKQEVEALILVTDHQRAADTNDQQIMADIDLSILGAAPAVYQSYADDIRREYAAIPEDEFRSGRKKVLQVFLSQVRLFHNEIFIDGFEDFARENMQRELAALDAE